MQLICPNPQPWNRVYQHMMTFAAQNSSISSSPPVPLILNGWVFSNDLDKMSRWKETIEWAHANGCLFIVDSIPESDYYFADIPTT